MDEAKKQRDSALADSEKARQDVAMLEETKQKMMGTIDVLDKRIKLLNETMTNIREGTVVFRVGEVLSSNVLNGGLSQAQTREELSRAMSQTNTMICRHLGVRDENTVLLYIAPDEFNATVDALQKAGKSQKLLRIIAAGNIMLGEPALVHVEMYDNNLIYHRGDVVYEERLTAQELSGNAELQVMRFLHNVNQQAQARPADRQCRGSDGCGNVRDHQQDKEPQRRRYRPQSRHRSRYLHGRPLADRHPRRSRRMMGIKTSR